MHHSTYQCLLGVSVHTGVVDMFCERLSVRGRQPFVVEFGGEPLMKTPSDFRFFSANMHGEMEKK